MANTRATAGGWHLTKYWSTGGVNTGQSDEAQTTDTTTVQDLPSNSDEEVESLWSERVL